MSLKTIKDIKREFDNDKYLPLRLAIKKNPKLKINQLDKLLYKNKKVFHNVDFLKKEKNFLKKIFNKYSKKLDGLIELGCGYGSKCLFLGKQNKIKNIYAYDISRNGIFVLKKLCKNENIKSNIKTKAIEVSKINFEKENIVKNTAILTSYFFTYVDKCKIFKILKNLLKVKPVLGIHLEPIYQNHLKKNLKNNKIRSYFKKENYSQFFFTVLKKLQKKKCIKIITNEVIGGTNKIHPFSLVIWKPLK
jgi:hypothetical protein